MLKAENLDAWLGVLLAPAAARPALLTVWALCAEVGRLPWRLREPLLVRTRMAFWRQALEGQGGIEIPPLLRLWPPALPRADMVRALENMQRLADDDFENAGDVFDWSEQTFLPLWRTLLTAVTISRDGLSIAPPDFETLETPLRALAAAYGAGFLLRRRPFARTSTTTPLFGGELAEEDVARALAKRALEQFDEGRRLRLPRRHLAALLPVGLMNRWLEKALLVTGFPTTPAPALAQYERRWFLLLRFLLGRL